ncbi:MAG TPA: cytochrome b N-terminal domain-containing protein, partial [Acidobacteriota bacterium]|nr:cytochrome b N-terminal domain-containing protein [Acidobacteriota bacterium]
MAKGVWKWIDDRWPVTRVVRAIFVEDIPGGGSYWFTTGSSVLFVFILQAVTGICELFFYVPTVDHAYISLGFLRTEVPFGWLIHNLHYWGATAMVVLVLLHMMQVYLWGAYKNPRQLTWILGSGLFLLTLAMMFTGSPLPWDEKGYWATEVGTGIAGMTPLVGDFAKRLLRGGETMGQLTLSRFFIIHVLLLSGFLATLILVHLVSFRKAGSVGPWAESKRLRSGPFWPDQVQKDLVMACLVFMALVALATFLPPAFTGAADPADALFTPKPEWTFLFLYQALKLFPGSLEALVAIGLPLVLVLILLAVPFVDRRPERSPARRPLALALYFSGLVVVVILSVAGGMSKPGAGQVQAPLSAAPPGQSAKAKTGESLAPSLIGNPRHGGLLFAQSCEGCHGAEGKGGIPNPGSEDGTVPSINPIDRDLVDPDPASFVAKIDPFLQHGSTPPGPKPALAMPAFGDSGALTEQQISHLEAAILDLNGVRRDKIMRAGISPVLFFVL